MILAYLENNSSKLTKGALVVAQAALQMKEAHGYSESIALLLGNEGISEAALEASELGFDKVVYVSSTNLTPYVSLVYQDVFKKVNQKLNPSAILSLANSRGKDLFPRIALDLEAGQASDVLEFVEGGYFKRPMYEELHFLPL